MVKQSGRKQSPCLSTKQAHDAPFQANEEIKNFASVDANVHSSTLNATSSVAKLSKKSDQPRWRRGNLS
jgi:hypothetical protein